MGNVANWLICMLLNLGDAQRGWLINGTRNTSSIVTSRLISKLLNVGYARDRQPINGTRNTNMSNQSADLCAIGGWLIHCTWNTSSNVTSQLISEILNVGYAGDGRPINGTWNTNTSNQLADLCDIGGRLINGTRNTSSNVISGLSVSN